MISSGGATRPKRRVADLFRLNAGKGRVFPPFSCAAVIGQQGAATGHRCRGLPRGCGLLCLGSGETHPVPPCHADPLGPGHVPQSHRLARGKLLAVEATGVCLARVLNRVDKAAPAMARLAAQGLPLGNEFHDDSGRDQYFFYWDPGSQAGPILGGMP